MAANEAIIRAAGQRYAPQKFDYSGYIKGLASVASFLVAKKKATTSRIDNISKISDDAIGNITDGNLGVKVEAAVQEQRDIAYQATKNMGGFHWTEKNKTAKAEYQKALTSIENIVKDNTNWNNLQGEIIKGVGNKTRNLLKKKQIEDKNILSKEIFYSIVKKMAKQLKESMKVYYEAGRKELAETEKSELKIIREYLPKQLSEQETLELIKTVITQISAKSISDIGKVMSLVMHQSGGKVDGGIANKIAKQLLQ